MITEAGPEAAKPSCAEAAGADESVEDTNRVLGRLARSGAWSVVAYGATAGAAFLISLMLGRALGPTTFGRYSYFLWLLRLLPGLLALGVPIALSKTVAEHAGRGDTGAARRTFSLVTVVHGALGAVAVAVASALVATGTASRLLVFVVVGVVVGVLLIDVEALLAGLRRFGLLGAFAAALSVGQVAVVAVGVHTGQGWDAFVELLVAVNTLGLVALFVVSRRSVRRFGAPVPLRSAGLGTFARFAGICSFTVLLDTILWGRPELFFLNRYHGATAVGFYSAALRIASLGAVLPLVAARPLLPELSNLRGTGQDDRLREVFRKATELIALVAAPLAFIGAAVAGRLVVTAYGASFADAAGATALLFGGSLVAALSGPLNAALLTGPRPRIVAELGVAAIAATIALDFALIPRFGVEGAAIANLAVQLAWLVATALYTSRSLALGYPTATVARAVGAAGVASVAAAIVGRAAPGTSGILVAVVAGAVTYSALILAARMLRTRTLARHHQLAMPTVTPR